MGNNGESNMEKTASQAFNNQAFDESQTFICVSNFIDGGVVMVPVDPSAEDALELDITSNEYGEVEARAMEDSGLSNEAFLAVFEDFSARNNTSVVANFEDILFIPGDDGLIEKMLSDCGSRFNYACVEKQDVEDFLNGVDMMPDEEDQDHGFEQGPFNNAEDDLEMFVIRHLDA
tara:strand:+ start:654 stop:1178 length:525 start_codon:yes stop_codon:yes gene_type:complete